MPAIATKMPTLPNSNIVKPSYPADVYKRQETTCAFENSIRITHQIDKLCIGEHLDKLFHTSRMRRILTKKLGSVRIPKRNPVSYTHLYYAAWLFFRNTPANKWAFYLKHRQSFASLPLFEMCIRDSTSGFFISVVPEVAPSLIVASAFLDSSCL